MSSGDKAEILVVDDNRVNRLLVAQLLEQLKHRVSFAENGRQALEVLRDHPVDLVLLDVEMPEMNGYQTLEALQADRKLRDIPVVMMSSVDEVDSVARCVEMGAEDYLFKPVNAVLLRARVAASLEKKRLRDQQRDLFRKFATAEVAEELLSSGFALGGKHVDATVMFSDIRGFTGLAESLAPADTIQLLNNYYTLMFDAIESQGGVVNQIVGDGLMALFGAPLPREDHRARAVILTGQRSPEQRHQAVTDDLIHDPALALDGVEHQGVVVVEQLDGVGRSERLRETREATDVREHDGGVHVLAAQRESARQQLLGHLGRRELAKEVALLISQALLLEARRHPGPQQHRVDGLEQVVLGAHLDTARDAVDFVDRRHHDDGNVAQLAVGLERLQRLVAVHLRHFDVEQHQIDRVVAQDLERLPSVLGKADPVLELFEELGDEQPVDAVVVHHEDLGLVAATHCRPLAASA